MGQGDPRGQHQGGLEATTVRYSIMLRSANSGNDRASRMCDDGRESAFGGKPESSRHRRMTESVFGSIHTTCLSPLVTDRVR
jgi:hypothetical protein